VASYHHARHLVQLCRDGRRLTIRLGSCSKRQGERVADLIQRLEGARRLGLPPDDDVQRWVASADRSIVAKLAKLDLCDPPGDATVADLAARINAEYAAAEVTPATRTKVAGAMAAMVEMLGGDTPMGRVRPDAGQSMRRDMLAAGLAEASVRKRCLMIRSAFASAMERGSIHLNPMAGVPCAPLPTKHKHYIDAEDAHRVLDALPDQRWRLMFALSRWGGLRMPSEAARMTWGDVHWGRGRLTIHGKGRNADHPEAGGGRERMMPLFPEVRRELEDWRVVQDGPGEQGPRVKVIPGLTHNAGGQLRNVLINAIKRAGVEPWPRLWHNMRASRQTELLAEGYAMHVVCSWLGNTPAVAADSYLQVTEDDYQRAAGGASESASGRHRQTGAVAPQNPNHPAYGGGSG
jgi:integrase